MLIQVRRVAEKKTCPLCTKLIDNNFSICPFCGHEFEKTQSNHNSPDFFIPSSHHSQYSQKSKPSKGFIDIGMIVVIIFSILGALLTAAGQMANGTFIVVAISILIYIFIYFIIFYILYWIIGKVYPGSCDWGFIKWTCGIFLSIIVLSICLAFIFGMIGAASTANSPPTVSNVNLPPTLPTTQNYVMAATPYKTIDPYATPTDNYVNYIRPKTGDVVKGFVISGGEGDLTIDNINGGADAVAILTHSGTKNILTGVYIRNGETELIQNIPDGNYNLYFASGNNWNQNTLKFDVSPSYTKFEDVFPYTTTNTEVTTWRVTLYGVVNGNAKSEVISEDDFPE
jgi:hypothetical protein